MTTYTCKTCGKISSEEGHLCDPTDAGKVYTCSSCGQQAKKKNTCANPRWRNLNISAAVAAGAR